LINSAVMSAVAALLSARVLTALTALMRSYSSFSSSSFVANLEIRDALEDPSSPIKSSRAAIDYSAAPILDTIVDHEG
jgi:hypothetical protein